MTQKNVLLICGGGGTEHDISLVSAKYILEKLQVLQGITPHYLCIEKDGRRTNLKGEDCELRKAGEIYNKITEQTTKLDYAIPCIHGPPGENGQIQSLFEMMGLPFLGASSEASILCFNKVTTKLWLTALGIANTPYLFIFQNSVADIEKVNSFFEKNGSDIFIKASNQGSSVGCYHITKSEDIAQALSEGLKLSPYVLIEKTIRGRELEVSVYEYQGKTYATFPGEIICPSQFYSYEEKYSDNGHTKTHIEARGLEDKTREEIKDLALRAFKGLRIKDLSRIDFFLTEDNKIYINEINTFPGHTPISMFPMMMENAGVSYVDYIRDRITTATN